jgi:hypothetical protein
VGVDLPNRENQVRLRAVPLPAVVPALPVSFPESGGTEGSVSVIGVGSAAQKLPYLRGELGAA